MNVECTWRPCREIDPEYHRDNEDIKVRAFDDELLTHAVWEIFQEEMDGVKGDYSYDDDDCW